MSIGKALIALLLLPSMAISDGGFLLARLQTPASSPRQSVPAADLMDMPFPVANPEMIDMNFMMDVMRPAASGPPYTADTEKEVTQVLADGTRISRKTSGRMARDAQGRTWRMTDASGSGNPRGGPTPEMIMIVDIGAHSVYMLMPTSKMALKMVLPDLEAAKKQAMDSAWAGRAKPLATPGQASPSVPQPAGPQQTGTQPSPSTIASNPLLSGNTQTESLGERSVEGVIAQGKRYTSALAAGTIGNDRPIEVVAERWYSKELQGTVMMRISDPRKGEAVFRLVNIRLEDPPASLFEIPADYTVQEMKVPFSQMPKGGEKPVEKPATGPAENP